MSSTRQNLKQGQHVVYDIYYGEDEISRGNPLKVSLWIPLDLIEKRTRLNFHGMLREMYKNRRASSLCAKSEHLIFPVHP